MKQVDELIIIIPVILNLKGNLEMNLSARLGTAANVGELDKADVQRSVIYGNLLLLQVQATVVSFVATIVSFVIGLAVPNPVQSTTPGTADSNNLTARVLQHLNTPLRRRPPFIPIKNKDSTQQSGFREFVSLLPSISSDASLIRSLA
jgi:solute carrier family 41